MEPFDVKRQRDWKYRADRLRAYAEQYRAEGDPARAAGYDEAAEIADQAAQNEKKKAAHASRFRKPRHWGTEVTAHILAIFKETGQFSLRRRTINQHLVARGCKVNQSHLTRILMGMPQIEHRGRGYWRKRVAKSREER